MSDISVYKMMDIMTDELFKKKSLTALRCLIECGRELEIIVDDTECFISGDNKKDGYSIWVNKVEQRFDTMAELICESTINDKPFLSVWESAKLDCLF